MSPDYDPNESSTVSPLNVNITYGQRESAKSIIRYKIEMYQQKAENLQALLDMLELLQSGYSNQADEILYEMVCSLK